MAFHDLSNTKTIVLGATPRSIPRIDGNPHERFSFAPAFSECFLGWSPRARLMAFREALGSASQKGAKIDTEHDRAKVPPYTLLMPLFLRKGCLPWDFQEGKQPIEALGEAAH